jgi:hypothetical protein
MSKIIAVKTEGLEGEALKFAQSLNEALKDLPEGISKEELATSLEKFKTDNPFPISKEAFDEMKETLNQLKEQSFSGIKETSLLAEIKTNKAAIKNIVKGYGSEDVILKANTTRASIATNPNVFHDNKIGQFGRIANNFYDRLPKLTITSSDNNGTYAYIDWDEATVVKAATAIAEGAAFPESTAAFKGYTIPLRKIGDTLPVTEEFLKDEALAAAELEMFLNANVNSAIGSQVINGNGTGNNLTGLFQTIPTYTAAASGISAANIYDLIAKVTTAIVSTQGSRYQVNFALMNRADIDRLVLAKDANNNYLFPAQHPIYSLLIEDNNVAANSMVVGDIRFAKSIEIGGIELSKGTINAQFTSDIMTLKARKRLAFLIRNVDTKGFRKVTNITTALTTLAS